MSVTGEYREKRYGDLYMMRYEQQSDGTWKIYAQEYPENPSGPRDPDSHVGSDGELCVDKSKFIPRTLEQAKACAYLWMEGYSHYVRTGSFPDTGGRVNV